jgi:hypothetical protein
MVTAQNVVMIVAQVLIDQQVVHTATEIPVRHRVQAQIAANVVTVHVIPVRHPIVRPVHTATAIRVQVPVHLLIGENVVTVHVIPVHRVIVQQVVHTETEIHVRHHVQVPIVHPVRTVTDQSVVMIVDQVLTVQQVAHMVTATHVRRHDHHQIVHVETTHLVAIVQRQAMIDVPQVALTVHVMIDLHAMIAAVRVTANAVDDQIVPEVVLPMIA